MKVENNKDHLRNFAYYKPVYNHPWRIPRDTVNGFSLIDTLLGWNIVIAIFSIAIEGVLPFYFSTLRSLTFLVTLPMLGLGVLRLVPVLKVYFESHIMPLATVMFGWTSFLYYINPLLKHNEVNLLAQLIIWSTFLVYVADTKVWRERATVAFWLGWFIFVTLSVHSFITGGNIEIIVRDNIIRTYNILGLPTNMHAFISGSGIIIAVFLLRAQKTWFMRITILASIGIGVLSLFLGNSRAGTTSLIFVIILYFVLDTIHKRKVQFQNILNIIAVCTVIFMVVINTELGVQLFESVQARVTSEEQMEAGVTTRFTLVEQTFELALQNPLVGIGQGNIRYRLGVLHNDYVGGKDPHNYYVKMFAEGGVIGASLMALIFWITLRNGWRWGQYSERPEYFYLFIYLMITAFGTGQGFHFKIVWLALVMNAVTPPIIETSEKDQLDLSTESQELSSTPSKVSSS